MGIHTKRLQQVLAHSWSIQTSTKYTTDNPARGQCGVTALVVHDILGGEILKTPLPEGWHFYNKIEGRRMDFSASQFTEMIDYQDIPSDRTEAFADTNKEQYRSLRKGVFMQMDEAD
ncbi:YunG family protein [Desmospora activa]|uniref:Uncharacterized protein n=1 Tax=Desmospora activa DSM 45169 TaxID=1121389 RepID=A0A2T4Z6Z4_9BACL|nr:hypothetical protein [Desmospora activa]PTM57651.1 hypothetical protein C8J48_0201 [Desmospora activa DSM 45169]